MAGTFFPSLSRPPTSHTNTLKQVEVVFNMTTAHLAQTGVLGTNTNAPTTISRFDPAVPILRRVAVLGDGVRLAARLVDAPPNEMHTDAMVCLGCLCVHGR